MMNPLDVLKLKDRFAQFAADHPKVVPFFTVVGQRAMVPGSVFELKVTDPTGKEYVSNIRLNENDIETIRTIMELGAQPR